MVETKKISFKEERKSLDAFKNIGVELFESADPENTGAYFTNDRYTPAKFQLLRFSYKKDGAQMYIRYPGESSFIEIYGGGPGSGRGDMTISSGENIWANEYSRQLKIFSHPPFMLLTFGGSLPEFNFLSLVSRKGVTSEYDINPFEVETVLSNYDYIALPQDARKVAYAFRDQEGDYILVDYPAYNFQYENHRFFVVRGKVPNELKIEDFRRARDGGSTWIDVVEEDGSKAQFFSPSPFNPDKKPTFGDRGTLTPCTEDEVQKLLWLLDIMLAPENKNEGE